MQLIHFQALCIIKENSEEKIANISFKLNKHPQRGVRKEFDTIRSLNRLSLVRSI